MARNINQSSMDYNNLRYRYTTVYKLLYWYVANSLKNYWFLLKSGGKTTSGNFLFFPIHVKFPDKSLIFCKFWNSLIFPCREFISTIFPVFPVFQSLWPPCYNPIWMQKMLRRSKTHKQHASRLQVIVSCI